MEKARNHQLDTVRGVACILLVAYHAIGGTSSGGLRFPEGSWILELNSIVRYVRMPLFTFLSGFVYSRSPVVGATLERFLVRKAQRLLIPLVVVGLFFLILKAIAPGVNDRGEAQDVRFFLFYPYQHLWYIQALCVVFVIVALVEIGGGFSTFLRSFAVFVISTFIFDARNEFTDLFAINRAFYLLPFFISGVILDRFGKENARVPWAIGGYFALFLVVAISLGHQHTIDSGVWLLAGGATAILLTIWTPPWQPLARIGFYSYTIYLYHVFGYTAVRVLLQKLGLEDRWLLLPLVVSAGITLPIMLHLVVHPLPYLSRALLGVKASRGSGRFNADREADSADRAAECAGAKAERSQATILPR